MRQAAEKAGLISPGGMNEVTFISEGEASLNMCIEHDLLSDSIRVGVGHFICLFEDANSFVFFIER